MGAPQFEQLTAPTLRRSASTCSRDRGRMKSFSRRKSKKLVRRPCPAGQRQYWKRVLRWRSWASPSRAAQRGHAICAGEGRRLPPACSPIVRKSSSVEAGESWMLSPWSNQRN
jgi:hypothetical protein